MAKNPPVDYQTLNTELEAILGDLQREDLDIDAALTQYERGLVIIKQLETYLEHAENRVTKLKAAADKL